MQAGPTTQGVDTPPFRAAVAIDPLGDGRYAADLGDRWTVGPKAHGGLLLVLLARAALARLDADAPGVAPEPGPVTLTTEVLKTGRTASVVGVRMHQDNRLMLAASVTAGQLPADEPRWWNLPDQPAEPPADAIDPAAGS